MAKIINYWDEARKEVLFGIELVAKAVMVTMWPKWKNVLLEKSFWAPTFTNDWVTVAKEIEVEDKYHNVWVSLVKESAEKTNKLAGDGTTTTTVLTYAIAKEWMKYIQSGVNPFSLSTWLHKAVSKIISSLQEKSKPVQNKEEIKQVASLSAQDDKVGELISEVMEEVGKDGVITIEEWKTMWLTKEVVTGMQFDSGYGSPYFVSDTQRMEAVVEKPYILITDKKVSSIKDVVWVLEKAAQTWKKDFVLIADDVEWEALANLVLNKMRWILNVMTVKAPWFGDRKKEMLKDIAVVTWATLITEDLWLKLEEATVDMLGQADRVVATKDNCVIVGWNWNSEDIDMRVQEIKAQIENTSSEYDVEKLYERLARLAGWVAVIKVWAATEMEMKNKKFKIEDALNATRAAVEEWIVPWGWITLVNLLDELENISTDDEDEKIGIEIIKKAIVYPVKNIADNAGHKGDRVIEKIKENDDFNYGFDAKTWEYTDLLKAGIIDPAKVIRIALENAVSAAAMFLTTDAVIVDAPKKDGGTPDLWAAAAAMWGMWWMGGMWWMPGMM